MGSFEISSGSVDILDMRMNFDRDKRQGLMFSSRAGGGMPEIGVLPFARVALDCATAILPRYRSRFSKHQFAQPQLLAVLCLMRYEDWTFREAEVRLKEHRELREVLQLASVPDYTTLYRFLRRLDDTTIDRVLGESVRRFKAARRSRRRRARTAVDGTGLAHNAASTFFIRRIEQRPRGMTRWSYWLKYLIVGDVDEQIILAQRTRQAPWCDCRALPALADAAARVTPIGLMLADAEFDTEQNHQHIRERLGARSIIPAKRGRSSRVGIRGQMRRHFPRRTYCQRAKVETIFSIIKRKLSARAPGRSLPTQTRQALLLGLAFNLYRLRHRYLPSRMSTEPFEILDPPFLLPTQRSQQRGPVRTTKPRARIPARACGIVSIASRSDVVKRRIDLRRIQQRIHVPHVRSQRLIDQRE